jgi:hypothetical protein
MFPTKDVGTGAADTANEQSVGLWDVARVHIGHGQSAQ